jgi:metal-responsive CopG/Arc/MetJ family transcriptional regulator
MVYQRINITLPAETLQALDRHVPKGDRSQFIHAAIQAYLAQLQKQKLRQQIKEGQSEISNLLMIGLHLRKKDGSKTRTRATSTRRHLSRKF